MRPPSPLPQEALDIRNDSKFRIQTALLWNRPGLTNKTRAYAEADERDGEDTGLEDLSLHRDRLAAAANRLGWNTPACLEGNEEALRMIRECIDEHMDQLSPLQPKHIQQRKVRVLVDSEGRMSVDSIPIGIAQPLLSEQLSMRPYIPRSLDEAYESTNEPCKVYLDLEPSQPSIFTRHKTTYRHAYDSARARIKLSPKRPPTSAEVLLYNLDREIFDASSCTVYFKRNGSWVTPAAACGPTLGVTRRVAIKNGLCEEGIVKLEDLAFNETLWLSNAVRGFFMGILAVDSQSFEE